MIMDKLNMLSEEQAITVSGASENVIDLGEGGNDPGQGEAVFLNAVVNEDFAAAGDATLTIALQDSADGASFDDVVVSGAIAKSQLTEGSTALKVSLPVGIRRYIRCNYTVATGPFTAGKISTGLSLA